MYFLIIDAQGKRVIFLGEKRSEGRQFRTGLIIISVINRLIFAAARLLENVPTSYGAE